MHLSDACHVNNIAKVGQTLHRLIFIVTIINTNKIESKMLNFVQSIVVSI